MKYFKDENDPLKSLKHSLWKWQICIHIPVAVCGAVAEETERLIADIREFCGRHISIGGRSETSSLLKIKQNRARFSFSLRRTLSTGLGI